jgi:hypothetical protein
LKSGWTKSGNVWPLSFDGSELKLRPEGAAIPWSHPCGTGDVARHLEITTHGINPLKSAGSAPVRPLTRR